MSTGSAASMTVPMTTLDELVTRFGRPAFCKIDVEGFELEVLRGLSTPLPALCFEYIPAAIHLAQGCLDRLSSLGDYRYNWTQGESHRFLSSSWLPAADMGDNILREAASSSSGDIYARLWQPS